jgi:hypothetical protein
MDDEERIYTNMDVQAERVLRGCHRLVLVRADERLEEEHLELDRDGEDAGRGFID